MTTDRKGDTMKIDRNGDFHGDDGRYISKNGLFKIGLDFFAENLTDRSEREIRKSIRSHKRKILEHKNKIERSYEIFPEWKNFSVEQQEGIIKSWKKEIVKFENNIKNCNEELSRRGLSYDEE